jgi:hypothetical protein
MKELKFDKSAVRKDFTVLEFPKESVLALWGKLDALNMAQQKGGGNVELYELWAFIGGFFPEHDFSKGPWRITRITYAEAKITNEPEPVRPQLHLPQQ